MPVVKASLEQMIARFEPKASRVMKRASSLREKATKNSPLERTPEFERLEKRKSVDEIVEPKKEGLFSKLLNGATKKIKSVSENTTISPLEQAKEIDSGLATRLEKIKSGPYSRPTYSGEEVLNIVEVNQKDPELAIRLAKKLENNSDLYFNTPSLFDMAKSDPEMFAVVKKHISPETVKSLDVLNNLQHVSAENVKHFPTKLVQELEKVGAESKKPIDEVFNQPVLKSFVDHYGKQTWLDSEVKDVVTLVRKAAENPVETERFLTKVNDKAVEVLKPASKSPLAVFHTGEVNELVKLHQENPKVVESIIEKFGFVKPNEIKVLIEYDKRGINVDKYVREFLEGNPYSSNGIFASDMEAYIKFRLKSGSVFSNMLKGKSDGEISEFFVKQLGKNKNNADALEKLERGGFKPQTEDELETLIDICNRYPDMKITKDFVKNVIQKRNTYGKDIADAFLPNEKYHSNK